MSHLARGPVRRTGIDGKANAVGRGRDRPCESGTAKDATR